MTAASLIIALSLPLVLVTQVSIKFVSNLDEFTAEQGFYSSIPTATGNNLGDFVPRLHDTIVGSSTTWSGEHHPPALVLERGHFSLEVGTYTKSSMTC